MVPVISVVVGLLLFVGLALFLARRGLHRTLETMPPLPEEQTLVEVRDVPLVFYKGGGMSSRVTYGGCTARVTTLRLLVAQKLGTSGPHRLLSVVLSPRGESSMRAADGEAISRALKSFTVGRVVPGSLVPTDDGGVAVGMHYLSPAVSRPNPPRWEFPPDVASRVASALREAGLC